ncbi:hypothetical protein HYV50_04360 [Candidatus Pacearchaeota archaeon]|nr:hypothetical protein [Candidatus Pacearchaeota archaeon]
MKEFDYYIFIDYSENLIGYSIIENKKLKELLPKISRFRHYRSARNRKLYLKNIKKTLERDNIKSSFLKLKIKGRHKNMEIYLDVLEFLKKHENCIIFISIDNKQYFTFRKMLGIADGANVIVKKESELIEGTSEYKVSLILDNLLNIERLEK